MKNFVRTLLKGVVVGLGAVAPGLSGSILLVMFGLYQKIVDTVSHIFKGFKKNVLFLLPLALGIGAGMVLFSKLIDLPLTYFPMQTYFTFLGLILGTIPLVLREVRKEGFHPKYYILMAIAFEGGAIFFLLNQGLFPDVTNPSLLQAIGLGLAVAAAYLVPGVDSFAILSAFGLYTLWKDSLANLDFSVLLPAGLGLMMGALAISFLFNKLLGKWYTATYSVVFGLFLAVILNYIVKDVIPAALTLVPVGDPATSDVMEPAFGLNVRSVVSVILLNLGFVASLLFSQLESLLEKRKASTATSTEAPAESTANK